MYDVIVVGAGHAGIEAALAAARMGARTLLLTMNLDLVGTMPCNPGVGGPGKGHLVREIDALGGEMARAVDRTFTHIRLLNESKGPAVRAPRANADKRLYALAMKHTLEQTPNLDLKQAMVEGILVAGDRVAGVVTKLGGDYRGRTVVLTTGTFLKGRTLAGEVQQAAGRAGEAPAVRLSTSLADLGFALGRHQTHTPPRVDARTIDFSQTVEQPGHDSPLYFSFVPPEPEELYTLPINPIYPITRWPAWRPQVPCYIVRTNAETHRIIRDNLQRSPVICGEIEAESPRYCPSIEEKMLRFPQIASHSLFLEPEGYATSEVYIQGLYTALPWDVQLAAVRSIPALARAEIVRYGYGVEYDYVLPYQLHAWFETKVVEGLFLAGQINGTSGYEEAAAQGLLAGINAAQKAAGRGPVVLGRDQGYIGVMSDDLVTKDLTEPYRMFTSRCEYRLLLRADNADLRLTPLGYQLGLVDAARASAVEAKRTTVAAEMARLANTWISPTQANGHLAARGLDPLTDGVNALTFLCRPNVSYGLVTSIVPGPLSLDPAAAEQVEIEAKYAGYINQQAREVARMRRLDERPIPAGFDFAAIDGLRNEARERLLRHRPATVGQASRLPGVNPSDIALLLVHLQRVHA